MTPGIRRRSFAPLSPASGRCPHLIASLCIVAGAAITPLLLIASLCIVAGAAITPLLLIASLCIVAGGHVR
jgi:hypothetical protein